MAVGKGKWRWSTILHIPQTLSLAKMKISVCEQKNLRTDVTGD
jgi:hypothetical protein